MSEPLKVVDLFAGPGGWDEGLRHVFPDAKVVGLEWDEAACATARAAGHRRIQGDVRDHDPVYFRLACYLHASPPCQGFSMAGKGAGRQDGERLLRAIELIGQHPDRVEEIMAVFDARSNDHRSVLTLEPLRWIIRMGHPQYVTLEQVPMVLPVWEAYAKALTSLGYAAQTAILSAEQYGVPQTRRRALLAANLLGPAPLPKPTHSRYYSRSPDKLDEGVLPWVSMAEALGWGMAARPSMTVTSGGTGTGGAEPFGNGARKGMQREREAFRWEDRVNNQSGTEFDKEWPSKRPAPTVAGREIITMPGANANRFNGATKSRNDGLRVEPWEAGVLQSFPADYPWQGGRNKQYEQIGNAVPPLLAAAIVRGLID